LRRADLGFQGAEGGWGREGGREGGRERLGSCVYFFLLLPLPFFSSSLPPSLPPSVPSLVPVSASKPLAVFLTCSASRCSIRSSL
jgi:hypothetical protein